MESDTDLIQTSEPETASPSDMSEDGVRSEEDLQSVGGPQSESEDFWDPDVEIRDGASKTPFSGKSKRTPSQRGSARFSRHTLTDMEREASEMQNILITQYGMDGNDNEDDDIICDVSDDDFLSDDGDKEVDYDTDLEIDMQEWLNSDQARLKDDTTGEHRYLTTCEGMGVTPATYFVKHIGDNEVSMKFHGLGPQGTKALCVPLKTNNRIEKLDLGDNWVERSGCVCVADMLRENIYITELILSENRVGTAGTVSLCEILMKNDTIAKLDLSGNEIKNAAAEPICEMLKRNSSLKHLYLNHNKFEEEAAIHFKEALSQSETLETLDLSWNMFRTKGTVHIAEGIQENYGLRTLNFSMNGLGLAGAEAMGKALKVNRTLTDLDISFNRIPEAGAGHIAVGLQVNDCLMTLKISSNPLGSDGSYALLVALDRNDCSSLKYLELQNVWVMDDFLDLKDNLERSRQMIIVYGGLSKKLIKLTTLKGKEWEKWLADNPMTKIKQYIRQTGYRLIDLFREFDKDGNNAISKQEFQIGIQTAGILMTDDQIDDLIRKLDKDGNGEIDYHEFLEGEKAYKRALREAAAKTKAMVEAGDDDSRDSETPEVIRMLNTERYSDKGSDKNSDRNSGKLSESNSDKNGDESP